MSLKRYEALVRFEKSVYNFNDVQIRYRNTLLSIENTQKNFNISKITCSDDCIDNMKKFIDTHLELINLKAQHDEMFEQMDKSRREYFSFFY